MYPKNMTTEVFTNAVKTIFVAFMSRQQDWSFAMATEEWNILMTAGVDVTSSMPATLAAGGGTGCDRRTKYLEKVRIGASFRVTRKARLNVLMTLENAINHACFSDEIYTG